MKQELTWGTAAAVAVVAAVGITSQSGSKPRESGTANGRPAVHAAALTHTRKKTAHNPAGHTAIKSREQTKGDPTPCSGILDTLEDFLGEDVAAPAACYESAKRPVTAPAPQLNDPAFQASYVIATLPDPLHSHFSLLFDRFIEAIQEGAQDERYEYDSSWLPWETEESSFALLKDQDDADKQKDEREDQPGILLFRSAIPSPDKDAPYKKALVVFVVGEESTRGIHREQFENAIAWIGALRPHGDTRSSVAILGPTFSGSFPSLTALLSAAELPASGGAKLPIYTGSATTRDAGWSFSKTIGVDFRSFLQDDDTSLDRFCRYVRQTTHLAILSEDETAYGNITTTKHLSTQDTKTKICDGATKIYYPRDISTLRAAYQSQSMFNSGSAQPGQDPQRKSLPTDLADPAGQQHDSVRTYAGNQTPLSQEALLLGIVEALRAHRAHYVVIRSSNNLDPLFLANFLRRDYPEARIAILTSDLLFQRGKDALALSGVMTISTYPLFSRARDWTEPPGSDSHSHRVFPENSTEGTYIASRLLLQTLARADNQIPPLNCEFVAQESSRDNVFVPSLHCQVTSSRDPTPPDYVPLPDYAPPFWTDPNACSSSSSLNCKPVTWLSVITRNGTWPLAAINDQTLPPPRQPQVGPPVIPAAVPVPARASWPSTPLRSARVLLVALWGLALFHALCCGFASFTAKPAFRAHFATAGLRHTGLILIGSYLIALMALLTGWGCGIFSATRPSDPPINAGATLSIVLLVCVIAALGMVANIVVAGKLNDGNQKPGARSAWRVIFCVLLFFLLVAAFFCFWVQPVEGGLKLASRAFAYFRSMNLTSGVSPIVPFLLLIMGLYVWCWYALHGLALFGPDRPCLPPEEYLKLNVRLGPCDKELKLSMFSQQRAATPVEIMAAPLSWGNVRLTLILFGFLAALVACLVRNVPVRSLGSTGRYATIFCVSLAFYFSLILAQAWQIWQTWGSVRQLLVFLDRMAFRRTLAALHGFSWGSVWKMSGNVLDVRYKLLSRQLECLTHLHNSLTSGKNMKKFAGAPKCVRSINASRLVGMRFGEWYTKNYDKPMAAVLPPFKAFQKQIARTTGVVLTELLVPASRMEKHSLIQVDPADKPEDNLKHGPAPSPNEVIRNAEELVCLTYLGFAQNLLGRIRTIVLGGVSLFLAVTLAVSNYPFDPRPTLSGALLLLFVVFGGVVVFTYADMHRDATLSHVTNTNPGELGSEFWFKVLGYGAAPLLGLITQIFPEWSGFFFSWLQPGLSSLK